MKTLVDFVRAGCVAVATLMFLGVETKLSAQPAAPIMVVVRRLHGSARFSNDSKTWQAVKKGEFISQGAVIQTAENSTLDIALSAGGKSTISGEPAEGELRLEANTVVSIDQLAGQENGSSMPKDVELDLRQGQIAGNAGPLPPGARFEIKFPKGIVGVRNGIFRMNVVGVVAVRSGEAVVVTLDANGNPTSNVVTTGKEFDPATGRMSDIPKTSSSAQPTNSTTAAPPTNFGPKGPGMGGSLRKF